METKEFFKGKKDWERKRKGAKEKISKIKKSKKKIKRKNCKNQKKNQNFKKIEYGDERIFQKKGKTREERKWGK